MAQLKGNTGSDNQKWILVDTIESEYWTRQLKGNTGAEQESKQVRPERRLLCGWSLGRPANALAGKLSKEKILVKIGIEGNSKIMG